MNNFFTLTKFELNKILRRRSSIIAIALFFCMALYIVISPMSYTYSEQDIAYSKALSGRELNSELIQEGIDAYKKIPLKAGASGYETDEYKQFARPYAPIMAAIAPAYFENRGGSISEMQNMDATAFYQMRTELVKRYIDESPFNENKTNYFLEQNSKIDTPFVFENATGYMWFLGNFKMIGMLTFFLTIFLISPIFAGEYGRTDEVILSCRNGKKSLIFAKIVASFLINILVFSLICFTIYLSCMLIYGFDGLGAAIQLLIPEIPYALTVAQTVLYSILCTLSLSILGTTITILFSVKLKSSLAVMAIMTAFGFGTAMMRVMKESGMLYNLYLLIPGNALSYVQYMDTVAYEIGNVILPPYIFIPIFSVVATLLLFPFICYGFKKHQVA